MPANRKPAKGGSKEHHRRISESLRQYHAGNRVSKRKKMNPLARWLRNRRDPANVRHRLIQRDAEYKRARREARKAEGDLAVSYKFSEEKRKQIFEAFTRAKQAEDQAMSKAVRKYKDT
jgi:hypothetical protein